MAQCVAAGFVGGLSFQHWTSWRFDRRNHSAFWLMLWSASLAALFTINVLLPAIPAGPLAEATLFVRSQVLASSVLLAMPAVRIFTGGRPIRPLVALTGALFLARAILWLTTDLVYTHTSLDGVPVYGPLLGLTFFAPATVVAWYVAAATVRLPDGRSRLGLRLASMLGVAGVLGIVLLPSGRLADATTSILALPVVLALQAMGSFQVRVTEGRSRTQRRQREALAEFVRAASSSTDKFDLLRLAETMAREHIGDRSIVGSIQALPGGRFSARFGRAPQSVPDPAERVFLDDLGEIVTSAAERMRLSEDLLAASFTDALTRLPNRYALELHLGHALARAAENGTRLAVLYCDIDGFKKENDQHGHSWGDELLRRTAGHLRPEPSEEHFTARFGGDEFVVVLEDVSSSAETLSLARRIRTDLDLAGTDRVAPLISVGVTFWEPGDVTTPEVLVRQADTAMSEGKRSRVGVAVFDDALRAAMVADVNLRRELDEALAGHQFELFYQPVADTATRTVVGVEALVRWHHPDGIRMPEQWIGFAEETGLIVPIGRQLVRAARVGARRLGLPVAVNVAASQLAEPEFVAHLREDWGDDDWQLLTLEITESALLQDIRHVVDSLATLRGLGVKISIDDFGTGYSSLARLAGLPVDVLKIDQAFVRRLDEPGGVAVVRAIVALAQALELEVVAEGVERADQAEALARLGVPLLQGYLIGRPAPATLPPVDPSMVDAGRRRGWSAGAGSAWPLTPPGIPAEEVTLIKRGSSASGR